MKEIRTGMPDKIKATKIKEAPTWGLDIGVRNYQYAINVWGILENGEQVFLFNSFRDQLPPGVPDDLIGLTVEQARRCKFISPALVREREAKARLRKKRNGL